MADDWHYATIQELSAHLRSGAVSPVAVTQAALDRIAALNPVLNAFITILADAALAQAHAAEAEIKAGQWRGSLHGVPVGVKDMYDTAGIRTTAAFEHFQHRIPTKDAVAVTKLKAAGAIIVGKLNMHELAMGTTSAVSYFGPVHNPWNGDYIAGGSSGGSAAALAAGLCYATLDTDAIGSCRLPASCCGVVGFKPSYALISNQGVLDGEPVDPTILWLAHAASTTRSADDAALVLAALAEQLVTPPAAEAAWRVGVVHNAAASTEVAAAFEAALAVLRQLGSALSDVSVPFERATFDIRKIEADRRDVGDTLFREVDLLVLPTTTAGVPTIAEVAGQPQALSPQNTLFANYYGLPAVSVPCGRDAQGLPLGLQIVGRPGADSAVLQFAQRYQAATAWAGQHPLP